MDTKIEDFFKTIKDLSIARDWQEISNMVDTINNDEKSKLLLLLGDSEIQNSESVVEIKNWLEKAGFKNYQTEIFNQPADNPIFVSKPNIEKILAVFECGKIVEPSLYQSITEELFTRPLGSYAILLIGTEKISNEEDLAAVEKIAWGAFVPDHIERLRKDELEKYGVFLWANENVQSDLSERITFDKNALIALLQNFNSDEFTKFQLQTLLNSAFVKLNQSESPSENKLKNKETPDELLFSISEIKVLRERFLKRFNSNSERLENRLLVSLSTLENELQLNISQYLSSKEQIIQNNVEQVEHIVERGFYEWGNNASNEIETSKEEISEDLKSLFENVDWNRVNQCLSLTNEKMQYPQLLLTSITEGQPSRSIGGNDWHRESVFNGSINSKQNNTIDSVIRYSAGIAVAALVAGIVTTPIGAVAGAIGGVLGMTGINQVQKNQIYQKNRLAIENSCGQFIKTTIENKQSEIKANYHNFVEIQRDTIDKSFEILLRNLNIALEKMKNEEPKQVTTNDRDILTSILQKTSAL